MADITLSPIPYNGGTLSMANHISHICRLTDTKFFAIFKQTTPNYTFGSVINVDNLKAAVPVATVAKQRVLGTTSLTRMRAWKLSASRVLVLQGADLTVYDIDGSDDMIKKNATIATFHSTFLWGYETAAQTGTGEYLHGQYISDNVVWFVQRTSTTSAITLLKVVYNPVGDTLTQTTIQILAASTTATHLWKYHIQKFADSNNYLVWAFGGNTAWNTSTITAAYIVTPAGAVSSTVSSIPTTVKCLIPLRATRIIGIVQPNLWRYWDGASWTASDASFASSGTLTTVVCGVPIDENYFMLCTSSAVEIGGGTYSYRVARVIDSMLGQSSPATATSNGLSYATSNVYFDQDMLEKVDADTFIVLGRASPTAFRIRVLHQPAA